MPYFNGSYQTYRDWGTAVSRLLRWVVPEPIVDQDTFLYYFFLFIHSRYDTATLIQGPAA